MAPLLDVIKAASQSLRQNLAAPLAMADLDPEFRDDWVSELRWGQSTDIDVLLALFDENFFTDSVIALDASNAEPVIRACAAIRLRLREKYLKALDDEILETSDIELEQLEEPVRKAFMCYLFLATLQELIIQHLDSTIIES
ncbi:MAG: hypothetical protein ABIV50_06360 [Opitutus sp.]